MSQKLLYKIQTTTPTHPPPSRGRRILPFPVLPLPSWEGQGEGEHEMANEDKQGMHPLEVTLKFPEVSYKRGRWPGGPV